MKFDPSAFLKLTDKEKSKFLGRKILKIDSDSRSLNESKEAYISVIKNYSNRDSVLIVFKGTNEHGGHGGAWENTDDYKKRGYLIWDKIKDFTYNPYYSWNIDIRMIKEIADLGQLEFDF